jgi:hypothetical protein
MKSFHAFLTSTVHVASSFAAPSNIVVMLVDDRGIMDTSLPFLTNVDGAASVAESSTRLKTAGYSE